MSTALNVLYASDENYAPFLGVSMFSLFKNNITAQHIRVYALLDNVSEENKQKLQATARQFGRELVLINAEDFNKKLKGLGVPTYRGNYTTNYRLFFDKIIAPDVERLIYLDCDTLICGDLSPLVSPPFAEAAVAVSLESLAPRIKQVIGFKKEEPYFNAGVLTIDVKNWKKFHITDSIIQHLQHVRARYCNPNQDVMNLNLKGRLWVVGPQYNFQPVHRAYSDRAYAWVYGFAHYYTRAEIDSARRHPVILHMYRFLGQFPWHKNNLHPDTPLFDFYLSQTLWKDYQKQNSKCNSLLFKIERLLYRVLPGILFLKLFATFQLFNYIRQDRALQHNKQNAVN